ncbi:uncharacterized protein LOC112540844 isoform X1 [Python bivittatus]|uniref:Uncharacterized protein LOC112540844 isoform X1 n=1 Tax=Python bivittatus TaxID=176946 RepID=A0A9F5MTH5_PYTBI|nr:uncharacterized protein LOC112540844 isoform X1 [Python bivittatus]
MATVTLWRLYAASLDNLHAKKPKNKEKRERGAPGLASQLPIRPLSVRLYRASEKSCWRKRDRPEQRCAAGQAGFCGRGFRSNCWVPRPPAYFGEGSERLCFAVLWRAREIERRGLGPGLERAVPSLPDPLPRMEASEEEDWLGGEGWREREGAAREGGAREGGICSRGRVCLLKRCALLFSLRILALFASSQVIVNIAWMLFT